MDRLKDKVALITGGANGIGLATARLFLGEGARVMLVDIDAGALEQARVALDPKNVSCCVADVSQAPDTHRYVADTLDKFGKIDIFFLNAGIEGISDPIADYPDEMFDRVLSVNLKGVWLGCKYVIPEMEPGGSAMITSSVAGLKGFAGLGAYVASKHGVLGLMRVAALENATRGIRINTIHPGPVNTNMMRRIEKDMSPENPREAMEGFEASVPFGRYAESDEIAQVALFLASDESKYITGCMHVVDGGMLLA